MNDSEAPDPLATHSFTGSSEMAERVRAHDWSGTPLGAIATWPQSLITAVGILLSSRYPMFIWWGDELINIYNDAYIDVLEDRHPDALGCPAKATWGDIWHAIGPLVETVLEQNRATFNSELELFMMRDGCTQETFFTFSYSPVAEQGLVRGLFCACIEDTERVVAERRLRLLRALGAATAEADDVREACLLFVDAVSGYDRDVAFALLYTADPGGDGLRLTGRIGLDADDPLAPERVDPTADGGSASASWPLLEVLRDGAARRVDAADLASPLPGGAWPEAARTAMVLPLAGAGHEQRPGLLVLGASPRRPFDDDYQAFFEMLANGVTSVLANAHAHEEQRRRADSLAELDRAKTVFFGNVSHEFRTPLTLMLSPLEEIGADERISERQREQLAMAHRNGLRLLKLVNTLLDFSRLEAGRIEATFAPTDLPAMTEELASMFRSAIEQAELELSVDCRPLSEPVYVDQDMWEKIVLNLLSNALKYTHEGRIEVTLAMAGDRTCELSVRDTGIGIPPDELPLVFDRFHRVDGALGRTQEGTGIGLALVRQLVELHGGSVTVESAVGEGSRFKVTLPLGHGHLPADRIGAVRGLPSTRLGAAPYVQEALRWLTIAEVDAEADDPQTAAGVSTERPDLLLADDNADMRDYLSRLLGKLFDVRVVADGVEALAAIEQRVPDLVLTDVMMPRLDGFGLLERLRRDPATTGLPVILLSARAGEEARADGLERGADDYIVKPFHARELIARVTAQIELAEVRRNAESRVTEILESITLGFVALDSTWRYEYVNTAAESILGRRRHQLLGQVAWEAFPESRGTIAEQEARSAMDHRQPTEFETYFNPWQRWFRVKAFPTPGGGLAMLFDDITQIKQAQEALRRGQANLRLALEGGRLGHWELALTDETTVRTPRHDEIFGYPTPRASWTLTDLFEHVRDDDRTRVEAAVRDAIAEQRDVDLETRVVRPDGVERWIWMRGRHAPDAPGEAPRMLGVVRDITDQKRIEDELREVDRRKDRFLATLAHELRNPLAPIRAALEMLRDGAALPAEQVTDLHAMMARQVGQLTHLVDDLMEVSRINSGKVQLQLQPVAVQDAVAVALETSSMVVESSGCELSVELPEAPAVVMADSLRLAQAITNVLNNAARYTPAGGHIALRVHVDGGAVVLSTRDDGIGISADELPFVFEPFRQVDSAVPMPSGGGLGIGLTLVRDLVERQGGTIEARSDGLGRGSEFLITLPLADDTSPQAAAAMPASAAPVGRGLRILVIDDNRDAADSLAMLMRHHGHHATVRYDGGDVLSAVTEIDPAVILIDLGLPGIDGLEIARLIRSHAGGAARTLVAVTGWGQEGDRARTAAAGFDHHLVKPADVDLLLDILEEVE